MKTVATIVAILAVMYLATSISPPDALVVATVLGTTISEERLIHRGEISQLLKTTLGVELGRSTIAKLFSPAVGQGCKPACYWGRRPLYRVDDVLAWAKSRLRPGPA
jgi:hypothetical protein